MEENNLVNQIINRIAQLISESFDREIVEQIKQAEEKEKYISFTRVKK